MNKPLVFLDTETTGFGNDDRVLEIGAVKQNGGAPEEFHEYVNPGCDIPSYASAVHGITAEFLGDKPDFGDIADAFIEFVRGAKVVIHNSRFDTRMLNSELARLGKPPLEDIVGEDNIFCTVRYSRRHNDDADGHGLEDLCLQFGIPLGDRATFHGALTDAHLLARVYPCLTQGE